MIHKTVLLKESIDGLDIHEGDIYFDGTLGSAGHTEYALTKVKDLKVIGYDKDEGALERAQQRIGTSENITFKRASYSDLDTTVNRIMLDLGLSSDQFETSGRGFTFKNDEPLLMSFKQNPQESDLTARTIVNTWEENNIADVIYGYGEERYSRRIAHAIVAYREKKSIETTGELVEIINQAVPSFYRRGRIHPATRTFQALRIAVNDELNTLKKGLVNGFEKLAKDGRMAIISFHSLEDRIVKHFYKEKADEGVAEIITKKPITASEQEILENPRSRSAKLRILQKII
jgi:16S rRNA (cytosine1402-N4)-methyltransferase